MSDIREEMPVLTRHEGDWVGTYTLVDIEGKILEAAEARDPPAGARRARPRRSRRQAGPLPAPVVGW